GTATARRARPRAWGRPPAGPGGRRTAARQLLRAGPRPGGWGGGGGRGRGSPATCLDSRAGLGQRPRSMAGVEPATAAPPPHRRRSGIPLGRVLGFPVHLSWSVLLLAALVTLLYGQLGGYLIG